MTVGLIKLVSKSESNYKIVNPQINFCKFIFKFHNNKHVKKKKFIQDNLKVNLPFISKINTKCINNKNIVKLNKLVKYKFKNCLELINVLQKFRVDKKLVEKMYGLIGNWDTSEITSMSYLFKDISEFNEDISKWNVEKVKDFSYMFYNTTKFNINISNWKTFSATNMEYMFGNSRQFNIDISDWSVDKVTNFRGMFIFSVFNHDISKWNISNGKDFSYMFYNNLNFNQILNWDLPLLSSDKFNMMFEGCPGYVQFQKKKYIMKITLVMKMNRYWI